MITRNKLRTIPIFSLAAFVILITMLGEANSIVTGSKTATPIRTLFENLEPITINNARQVNPFVTFVIGPDVELSPSEEFSIHTTSLAFSPDGRLMASGHSVSPDVEAARQRQIWHFTRLWDTDTGQVVASLKNPFGSTYDLAFSPDGLLLADSAGWPILEDDLEPPGVLLWNVASGNLRALLRDEDTQIMSICNPLGVIFSPDGSVLATISSSFPDAVEIWDVQTAKLVGGFGGTALGKIRSITFSPNGTLIAFATQEFELIPNDANMVGLYSRETELIEMPVLVYGYAAGFDNVVFSPDGTLLVFSSNDGYIWLWDVKTNKEIERLVHNQVQSLAFSPDGSVLASAGRNDNDEANIRLWDVQNRTQVAQLQVTECTFVSDIVFNPNGTILTSSCWDGGIQLWAVQ
jgi:WD40 repeat protein